MNVMILVLRDKFDKVIKNYYLTKPMSARNLRSLRIAAMKKGCDLNVEDSHYSIYHEIMSDIQYNISGS